MYLIGSPGRRAARKAAAAVEGFRLNIENIPTSTLFDPFSFGLFPLGALKNWKMLG